MGLFSVAAPSAIASVFNTRTTRKELTKEHDNDVESVQSVSDDEIEAPIPEPIGEEKSVPVAKADAKPKKPKVVLDEKAKHDQTVFFGNLNSSIILDKDAFKDFKTFIRQAGEVVSVRFRSIAFSEMLPRKAAFILQKLHPARDAVNAYVVYKTSAGATAAMELNGEMLLDHHVRVDSLANPLPQYRKRSVFLGNLDFEAKEEDLYRHFESCGAIDNVRIVRDSKTNVGKGFGYVQFRDASSVPLAIMMSETPFNGRALRITHCKNKEKKSEPDTKASKPYDKKSRKPRHEKPGEKRSSEVLEGERAKAGKTNLGRRKPRHRNDPTKRAKKHRTK